MAISISLRGILSVFLSKTRRSRTDDDRIVTAYIPSRAALSRTRFR